MARRPVNAIRSGATRSLLIRFSLVRSAGTCATDCFIKGVRGLVLSAATAGLRSAAHRLVASNTSGSKDQSWFSMSVNYRSAFIEAIGLPAISEHLPGVRGERCSRPSRVVTRAASAERSSPDRISRFHRSFRKPALQPPACCHAARRCSPAQVNTRLASNASRDRYHPQIIFTIFRLTAVIAFAPGIFCTPVLW